MGSTAAEEDTGSLIAAMAVNVGLVVYVGHLAAAKAADVVVVVEAIAPVLVVADCLASCPRRGKTSRD